MIDGRNYYLMSMIFKWTRLFQTPQQHFAASHAMLALRNQCTLRSQCNNWQCVYSRASPLHEAYLGCCATQMGLERRSHLHFVNARLFGCLRAMVRMSIIVWQFCFSRKVLLLYVYMYMYPQHRHCERSWHESWIGDVSLHDTSTLSMITSNIFMNASDGRWV